MTDLSDLTPREIAVASLVGRRWIVKRIAHELRISETRVYVLMASIATKIRVPDGEDDRQCIGEWWRDQAALANAPEEAA